jgi:hypothetical protein
VGSPSSALPVTIAHESLSLAGAVADVVVDLDAETVTGYPSIPGGVVGIAGIPVVNLDAASNGVDVLGTVGDDDLSFIPTTADDVTLTRGGSTQVINLTSVVGLLEVDPLGGNDDVGVIGTDSDDVVDVVTDTTSTLQIGATKRVDVATATTEQLDVQSLGGQDAVAVTMFDTVDQLVTVDAAAPSSNPKNGDELTVAAGSPRAKVQKQTSAVKGSGSVFVDYFKTTLNVSRVDYAGIEKITTSK